MRTLLLVALGVSLMTGSVFAQKMGMANRNAPTVTQSITFAGKQTFELSYTSITWAQGEWAKAIESKNADMRKAINDQAEKTPLGTAKLSADMMIGGKKVAAGTYKVAFTLTDTFTWQLTFAGDKDKITWALDLKDGETGKQAKRLTLAVLAGDTDTTAVIHVAFGTKRGEIPVDSETKSG
jgi:hypothetical protein